VSSYSKLIIFIVVLALILAAILFIDSSTGSMNKSMKDISDGIVHGDSDYNEAVNLVNNKSFYEGMVKADSAEKNYNNSLSKLLEFKANFSADINSVHQDYIDTVIKELELKLEAVGLLKKAIDCFKVNENATGTNYASQANDLIYQAKQYQNQRDELVADNPNLFKEEFSI